VSGFASVLSVYTSYSALNRNKTIEARGKPTENWCLLNVQQKSAGLRPLLVTLPPFTADQQVLIAVRAFNGAAGTDGVGLPVLQEYELAVNNDQLVLSSVPPRGGTSDSNRVVYRAAPGEDLEIKPTQAR